MLESEGIEDIQYKQTSDHSLLLLFHQSCNATEPGSKQFNQDHTGLQGSHAPTKPRPLIHQDHTPAHGTAHLHQRHAPDVHPAGRATASNRWYCPAINIRSNSVVHFLTFNGNDPRHLFLDIFTKEKSTTFEQGDK